MKNDFSENDKTIILLCGFMGDSSITPLSTSEYSKVATWLLLQNKQPYELLKYDSFKDLSYETKIPEERIKSLLGRGFQMGTMIDEWKQKGISIITRSSPYYPIRLKKHLQQSAPPILYYVGNISSVNQGGVAIVGSRNIDNGAECFTKTIAQKCATEKMYVISGGAKGVDQISVSSALEFGGRAICVVSDGLLKKSLMPDIRKAILANSLVLLSPYSPKVPFNVGNAMGRNKLIYALSDYAVVVSSDYNKGGTWAGATEEMRRHNAIPVFVRNEENIPLGNQKLIEKGAISINLNDNMSIKDIFNKSITSKERETTNNTKQKSKSKRKKIIEKTLDLFENL